MTRAEMDLSHLKLLALFVVFGVTFLFGLIPYALLRAKPCRRAGQRDARWRKLAVSFCSCFAGGVFLGTCLVSLIPEVRDILSAVGAYYGLDRDYPNTELLVGAGFFCILFVEQAILAFRSAKRDFGESSSVDARELAPKMPLVSREQEDESPFSELGQKGKRKRGDHAPDLAPRLRSLVLLLALSVHSLFEGMALGLQDKSRLVVQIMYALLVHKSVLAFSLGSSLTTSGMKASGVVKSCVLFALMSPIGIGIGIGVMASSSYYGGHLISGLMQGLASGTFLYVTMFEVMAPEFNVGRDGDRLWKVLFIAAGFASIAFADLFHIHNIKRIETNSTENALNSTAA